MSGVHDVATAFGDAAAVYERARPGYPPEAVTHLVHELGLGPGCLVADVGAGTGKLTRLLAACGATVVGVEPVAGMLAQLAAAAPHAFPAQATADAMPLASGAVDGVTVAQAVHWFGPGAAAELARVVRSGGGVAIVYNVRDREQPVHATISAVRERVARGNAPAYADGTWRSAFEQCPAYSGVETSTFSWSRPFEHALVIEQVRSLAPIAALDQAAREDVLHEVSAVLDGEPDPITLRYSTEVHLWRRV